MENMEILKYQINNNSEEKLNNVISDGVLMLSKEKKDNISFVFWFCYLVETDLNEVLVGSWNKAIEKDNLKDREKSLKIIKDKVFKDENINIDNLEYFRDKIKLYIFAKGKNKLSKLLWEINNIRNDLSHNRIDSLEFNNKSLFLKETKKELLLDYFSLTQRDEAIERGSFKEVLNNK